MTATELDPIQGRLDRLDAQIQDAEKRLAMLKAIRRELERVREALEAVDAILPPEPTAPPANDSQEATAPETPARWVPIIPAGPRRRKSRTLIMEVIRSREQPWTLDEIEDEYGERGHLEGVAYPTETVRAAVGRLVREGQLLKGSDGRYRAAPQPHANGQLTAETAPRYVPPVPGSIEDDLRRSLLDAS